MSDSKEMETSWTWLVQKGGFPTVHSFTKITGLGSDEYRLGWRI